ncbi:hypothetical protein ACWF94_20285, partial [Streptomyces sp. NPDC055078]
MSFVARTAVSMGFQAAPDRYESGVADNSASTRPSDNCQNLAWGVRCPASSLIRFAGGDFLPFG